MPLEIWWRELEPLRMVRNGEIVGSTAFCRIFVAMRTANEHRRDLIGTELLSAAEIIDLLDRSEQYFSGLSSAAPFPTRATLSGRTVGNLFFENSTRTRISFELAEARLGATYFSMTTQGSSVVKGESLLDTVRVVEAMKLDAIVIRHASAGAPQFVADNMPPHVHVINAGDGAHEHPTQALLDAGELRRALGSFAGKRIAIIGDIMHSRVARSNIYLLRKLGAAVTVVAPTTLMPRMMGDVFGVAVKNRIDEEVLSSDAIIALRIQLERQERGLFPTIAEYRKMYGLSARELQGRKIILLHPGPVNQGIELTSDALELDQSVILSQVKRGVAVRMAVLEWLFDEA